MAHIRAGDRHRDFEIRKECYIKYFDVSSEFRFIDPNIRNLRSEQIVFMTIRYFWFLSLNHLHSSPLGSQETNKRLDSDIGGSDVEMNLFHGCSKSHLCVVNAFLSARGGGEEEDQVNPIGCAAGLKSF